MRFVDGRPVSSITTRFLSWCCEKLEAAGKRVLCFSSGTTPELAHLQRGQALARKAQPRSEDERARSEDRELPAVPKKSPWLNAIEPKWVHGKRKVVEPDGLLGAYELADRVCRVFSCPHYEHLSVPRKVV